MTKKLAHGQANKHLKDILLLFSVPIGIVFIIVALIYVPRLFANPTYDFVYCTGYTCDNTYSVDSSGKIKNLKDTTYRDSYDTYSLRYYDMERDTSRPISFEDAQSYQLDASTKSPDDYTLERHSQDGGPFAFSYQENWSLKNGMVSKPVTLNSNQDSYASSSFIGWVISDE